MAVGPRTFFNSAYGNSWMMNLPTASYIEVNFEQPRQYDGKDIYDTATLRLQHLSSTEGPHPGDSPIDIIVNGETIAADHSPGSGNYIDENWDVTDKMQDGLNTVRLQFKDAATNYWIRKLQVDCNRLLS